jgi:hypothetical protein
VRAGADGAFLLGAVCGFVIVLVIGALILCAAVWLANKCLPEPVNRRRYYDDDDDDYDDWSDYDRPRRGRTGTAIPAPNIGYAMVIVLVTGVATVIVGFMMGFVAGAGGLARNPLALRGCSFVIGFFIATGLLSAMLPTTYPRACLVWLFEFLIGLAIGIVIVAPILVVTGVRLGGLFG